MFLANFEIQYAAEEIDEKVCEDQGNAIALGLEVTKRELADIKEVLIQLTRGKQPLKLQPRHQRPPKRNHVKKSPVNENRGTLFLVSVYFV